MTNKSYVSLEQHICIVCGVAFDTGSILFDKRLRSSMDRYTATGWGLCSDHLALFNEGFVALVECDEKLSDIKPDTNRVDPSHVHRTGCLAHLKRDVFSLVFDEPIAVTQPCVFIEQGVIEKLQSMIE